MTRLVKRLALPPRLLIPAGFGLAFLALPFSAPLTAQEDELEPLRAVWRAGDYRAALGPLKDLRIQLGESANFELDYMIGTALCKLSEYHTRGCEYFRSMEKVYDLSQRQVVDGESLDAGPSEQDCCKAEAGARVLFDLALPRRRNAILDDIPASIQSQKKKVLHKASGAFYPFTGTYEMVHDGSRGTLSIRGPNAEYVGSDGNAHRVEVRISDYHIMFFIMGLGGENAEGTGGQKFDGYMMTQTRDAIAGLTWWKGSTFGFYAVKK